MEGLNNSAVKMLEARVAILKNELNQKVGEVIELKKELYQTRKTKNNLQERIERLEKNNDQLLNKLEKNQYKTKFCRYVDSAIARIL